MSGRLQRLAPALVVLAAVALVHGRSVGFGFTYLDDEDLIVDDQAFLARPANLAAAFGRAYMHVVDRGHAYYRPLVTASYVLDAQWSGVRPLGYHATNVALHAAASLLLLALLRRYGLPRIVATGAALVFAAHPALAAAVAWIPGRNDSLLTAFALSAWILFLRDRERPSGIARALHFVFLSMALLAKETAVVLPLVWAAHAALLEPRGLRRERRASGAVYAAGWVALVAAILVAHGSLRETASGAGAPDVARALRVVGASLGKIVFPFSPSVLAVPEDLSPWPGGLAATGLALGTRWVPGVRRRVVVLGLAAFILPLMPVLAVPGTLVLDCRLDLPACGVLLAVAEIVRAAIYERPDPVEPRLLVGLTAVAVGVLGVVTAAYEESFRDRRAFAREAVAGSPHSALAHFCLGQSYQIDGEEDRAMAEYATSLALDPGEVVHNNVAVIHMKAARWVEAEHELREELAINPRYARAYENLAIVLHREARDDEARAAEERARELERE